MNKEPKTTVWLFDLDNTLHHADEGIFYLINRRMTAYLMRHLKLSESEADHLRRDYWHRCACTIPKLTSPTSCATATRWTKSCRKSAPCKARQTF